MATAEVELKSPCPPFFKGGIFSVRFSPLFAKEGKGRFSNRMTLELYIANFCSRLLKKIQKATRA